MFGNKKLESLPPNLPNGIFYLNCENNNLKSLPENLPVSLSTLNCSNNPLESLPTLPPNLLFFNCINNGLKNLPTLPPVLMQLFCNSNDLVSLPELPIYLNILNCGNNERLQSLPELPDFLHTLICDNNPNLRTLPRLPPSLLFININFTPLPEFTALPDNINQLNTYVQDSLRAKLEEHQPQIHVNAYQVHNYSSKINIKQLIQYFINLGISPPENELDANFIQKTLTDVIEELFTNNTIDKDKKNNLINGLTRIIDERLKNYNYENQSLEQRQLIYYSLKFVLQQNNIFKKTYVESFINDCVQAYEGSEGMTCANGALERVYLSLVPASISIIDDIPEKKKYEELIAIINFNPQKLIIDYMKEWFEIHRGEIRNENSQFKGLSTEQKINNLKDFLKGKFPDASEEIIKLIDELVGSVTEGITLDKEEDFIFAGKRKTRKIVRRRKRKTLKNGVNKY
jgi:hypothetical protein